MKFTICAEAKKAIMIGGTCSASYLAVYVAKNVLGAVSPQMVESGAFSVEQIGTLSTVYFISYAVGQLINGRIGDKVKTKYMISLGLLFAGLCNAMFALLAGMWFAECCAYGMIGFFLSMIYGPMTKVVAENTDPVYTTRCSLGYTFASFFGTPLAGILSAFLLWRGVFSATSFILVLMSLVCLRIFTGFEKRGVIVYHKYQKKKEVGGIRVLLRHRIIKFTIIAVLTGVVRTTVVFWLPTYLSQSLGFEPQTAALLFTGSTFVISMTAFVAVFLYERLGRNMDLTILLAFSCSSVFFLLVFLVDHPIINLLVLILAIMSSNCAASMLWSRYCPSLRDTGRVSSATGFLDFMSYVAAAVSSTVFANAVSIIGWGNLILVWLGLMLTGVIVALPYHKNKKRYSEDAAV